MNDDLNFIQYKKPGNENKKVISLGYFFTILIVALHSSQGNHEKIHLTVLKKRIWFTRIGTNHTSGLLNNPSHLKKAVFCIDDYQLHLVNKILASNESEINLHILGSFNGHNHASSVRINIPV